MKQEKLPMNFTTKIPIEKSQKPIDFNSKIMSLGSCFAENMGEKLEYFKFQQMVNPFGIIFNPVSIEKLILRAINQKKFTEEDLFFHNERWHCFEVHSDRSNSNKEEILNNLNDLLQWTKKQLVASTHIIITYGTSWVYRDKYSQAIVANCHKVPQSQFDKEILSVTTIEQTIQNTIEAIRQVNIEATILFTVSPVRHIKDGFVENQRSKAHLLTAIHNTSFNSHHYFPSYEILMDELRDYRFYAEDMLHPNATAIAYIWQRFKETWISEAAYPIMEAVNSIQKGLSHRPFYFTSENHLKFKAKLQEKITNLISQYPQIKF